MSIIYHNYQADIGFLAKRETRYFLGIAQGFSDKQIARDCGVSPHTVAGARKRILYKFVAQLHVQTMAEAILKAGIKGMIRELCIVFFVAGLVIPAAFMADHQQPVQRHRISRITRYRSREVRHVISAA